ncbi:DNA topoisomerase IB [Brevundimonas balnearis]|uniref:DNA topoisomerase n=1 Tax=Brevundimonas balnearis TaxID=1572858 RepID=A0ABV6R4P5_9CAUL
MPDGSAALAVEVEIPKGLSYCSDEQPGLTRRGTPGAFSYIDAKGREVTDERTLDRIRTLAIPPAWTDVWICPRATGHIQATGRDQKGRKQYRYHADWSSHRSTGKFDRMPAFARALPRLRRRVEADLNRRGVCREKVLATTVRLLELTLIRIGNAQYAKQNRSYGLTTLHKRHLEVDGSALLFSFRGKSGKDHAVSVRDRRLARVIRSLQDLPGQQVFKYRDADGDLVAVTSDEVNAYIRGAMGEDFSAKDFRTWAATVSAARALRDTPAPTSASDAKRKITVCVKAVSGLLGNTPTVCRTSYVHPRVFEMFERDLLGTVLPAPDAKTFETRLARALSA